MFLFYHFCIGIKLVNVFITSSSSIGLDKNPIVIFDEYDKVVILA